MSSSNYGILILTSVAAVFGFFIIVFDAKDKKKGVIISASLQLAILIGLFCLSLKSTIDDSRQKDRIENLSRVDSSIGRHIESLSQIGNLLDSNIQKVVAIDTGFGHLTVLLTRHANDSIGGLTEISRELKLLMNDLNVKTDQEFAVSGEFNFAMNFNTLNAFHNRSILGIHISDAYFAEVRDTLVHPFDRSDFFRVYGKNLKVFIDAKIYDLNGNLIADVEGNKWRINRNSCSKFNYDKNGFEVFDNSGRVALSVDFAYNSLYLQGILPMRNNKVQLICNNHFPGKDTLSYGTPELNKLVYDAYDRNPVKPLFQYTGTKWRGLRVN